MKVIKLDAIDSTNDFKGLSNKQELENFTITTENQTNGKGQMGSVWTLRWVRI
jgi:biotin-(acetyl-CoA carboxylase) ligase